jgi:Zn-dependent protease with chaperone function
MDTASYYPPSPAQRPADLVKLAPSYKVKVALAVAAIAVFFALYFALVGAFAYLLYLAVIYQPWAVGLYPLLIKIGAIGGAGMLFVFTLKFLFKLRNLKPENRIKLQREEHPRLFDFVDRICQDTGAPKPKAIYVDPDVNAYVAYSNPWLSLIMPVRKELTLGLGLVDCLNLSQFKAVVAHEFGHFAQRSMTIGSYIMSANTIIHDMIFSRDKWDEWLAQWRGARSELALFAWLITPIIWMVRQLLRLFYIFLNLMYSSLSREMEFNADKVAVSASGSEAIVSALWRLETGAASWGRILKHVYLASQKKIFPRNLYAHNRLELERKAERTAAERETLPDDSRGGKQYFATTEASTVNMYASHPPNDQREHNAKTPFVPTTIDERSPWLLFSEPEALQEQMTRSVYANYWPTIPEVLAEPEAFEQFVQAETLGTELLEEYGHAFANRFLFIPEAEALMLASQSFADAAPAAIEGLKAEITAPMEEWHATMELMSTAQAIAYDPSLKADFSIDGITYGRNNLPQGINAIHAKQEELGERLKQWDTAFLALHLALAQQQGRQEGLLALYSQYQTVKDFCISLMNAQGETNDELRLLQAQEERTQADVDAVGKQILRRLDHLNEKLQGLDQQPFFPLPNISNWQELREAIVEGGLFDRHALWGRRFDGQSVVNIMNAWERASSHCHWIDGKLLAAILAFHRELQQKAWGKKEGGSDNAVS